MAVERLEPDQTDSVASHVRRSTVKVQSQCSAGTLLISICYGLEVHATIGTSRMLHGQRSEFDEPGSKCSRFRQTTVRVKDTDNPALPRCAGQLLNIPSQNKICCMRYPSSSVCVDFVYHTQPKSQESHSIPNRSRGVPET